MSLRSPLTVKQPPRPLLTPVFLRQVATVFESGDYASLFSILSVSYIEAQLFQNIQQSFISSPFSAMFLGLFLGASKVSKQHSPLRRNHLLPWPWSRLTNTS